MLGAATTMIRNYSIDMFERSAANCCKSCFREMEEIQSPHKKLNNNPIDRFTIDVYQYIPIMIKLDQYLLLNEKNNGLAEYDLSNNMPHLYIFEQANIKYIILKHSLGEYITIDNKGYPVDSNQSINFSKVKKWRGRFVLNMWNVIISIFNEINSLAINQGMVDISLLTNTIPGFRIHTIDNLIQVAIDSKTGQCHLRKDYCSGISHVEFDIGVSMLLMNMSNKIYIFDH